MIEQGGGHIINITSATALNGFKELASYGASKGAVRSLTQHLACEWAQYGISVNVIAPGWFITELNRASLTSDPQRLDHIRALTPAKRIGNEDFEDLRAPIEFLTTCSNYVTGLSIAVDGGFSIAGYT